MGELVGKRLVGKTRRDLDDISERTAVPLVSCRRQFDNLRAAIYRAEEAPNDLHVSIRRKFLLSEGLAQSYVALVFLNHHQIRIAGHELLECVPLQTALDCAHVFIRYWTINGACLAFNPRLTHVLRDLQSAYAALGKEQLGREIAQQLHLPPQDVIKISKLISKTVSIGSCLLQLRKLHDLFIEIIEEIVMPLKAIEAESVSPSSFFAILLVSLREHLDSFFAADDDSFPLIQSYLQGLSQSTIFLVATLEI